MNKQTINLETKEALKRIVRNKIKEAAKEGNFSVNITLPDIETIKYIESLGFLTENHSNGLLKIIWN